MVLLVYLLGPFDFQELACTHEFSPLFFSKLGCRPGSHFVKWMDADLG